MLDNYNNLNQFQVPSVLNELKTIFNRVPARPLQTKSPLKRVILISDHDYLPFQFIKQILNWQGTEADLKFALKNPSVDQKNLLISTLSADNQAIYFDLKSKTNHLTTDWLMILKLAKILDQYQLSDNLFLQLREFFKNNLTKAFINWGVEAKTEQNLAKKIALHGLGRTGLFITSQQFAVIGRAFVKNWQWSAKNIAFNDQILNFKYQNAIGWIDQPVQKPYSVFDIASKLDSQPEREAFVWKNRFLSGRMPAPKLYFLQGDDEVNQLIYGLLLAQFAGVYLASLYKNIASEQNLFR